MNLSKADIRLEKKLLINKNINLITSFQSTGFKNNYESSRDNVFFSGTNELENILYDPQTNGPMLMVIGKKDQLNFENDFLKLNSKKPFLIGAFTEKSKNINAILLLLIEFKKQVNIFIFLDNLYFFRRF